MEETKPMKRLEHSLTFGNLWLYICSLIRKRKKAYAYALDDDIEKSFSFKPNRIMIYVVLYKLEAEGIIASKFEDRRKYYTLTSKGEKTLATGKGYLKKLSGRL